VIDAARLDSPQYRPGTMKKALRIVAAVLLVTAAGYWLVAGANCGWTKTSVPVKTVDEVTGLEHFEWQDKFVPGLDFLGAAMLPAGALAGVSLILRNKISGT